MRQEHFSPRQHRWIDVLSEFDFNIQYVPGRENKFADSLSRIYSDEPDGVVRADSELVDEGDDAPPNVTPRIKPVYVEVYLLDLMSAEAARRSSRIARKPPQNYKETKPRASRPKNKEPELTVVEEPASVTPPQVEQEAQSPPAQKSEKGPEEPSMVKNDLFETSSDLGISFPECIKGWYSEDKFFIPILANPDKFTNFVVKDALVFFTLEEAERVAVPDVLVNDQRVREVLIGPVHLIL